MSGVTVPWGHQLQRHSPGGWRPGLDPQALQGRRPGPAGFRGRRAARGRPPPGVGGHVARHVAHRRGLIFTWPLLHASVSVSVHVCACTCGVYTRVCACVRVCLCVCERECAQCTGDCVSATVLSPHKSAPAAGPRPAPCDLVLNDCLICPASWHWRLQADPR